MPIIVNNSISNNSPKPLDDKYAVFENGTTRPYNGIDEVNLKIIPQYRYVGLTVLVNDAGKLREFWYQNTTDGGLIPKEPATTTAVPTTAAPTTTSTSTTTTKVVALTTTTTLPYVAQKLMNIAFHLGTTPLVDSISWNSWGVAGANMNISNLRWADGSQSGVSMYISNNGGSIDNGDGWGTGNTLGIPAEALRYGTSYSGGRRLSIGGLDPNRKYNITLVDSRKTTATTGSSYTVFARNRVLESKNNISSASEFLGVKPTYKGQVDIYIERSTTSGFNALMTIRLTEINDVAERAYTENPNNVRYATGADLINIPEANEGDLIVEGPTDATDNSILLSPENGLNPMLETKYGQKKILINAGDYSSITILAPGCNGTPSNPILITNYGGKVKTQSFTVGGMRYFKVTGKFDPTSKTGNVAYQGHAGSYRHTAGKYGIEVNSEYSRISGSLFSILGVSLRHPDDVDGLGTFGVDYPHSDFTCEWMELCNGSFANMFKWDNKSIQTQNVLLENLYVHDTHGEGAYIGPTHDGSIGPNRIKNLTVRNCRFLRNGAESIQFSQNTGNCLIENNVFFGGINWKSPFDVSQDGVVNLSPRGGGNTVFRNNIVLGGSSNLHVFMFDPSDAGLVEAGLTTAQSTVGPLTITNNLFLYPKANVTAFIDERGTVDYITSLNITNNFFGQAKYRYSEVYTSTSLVRTDDVLRLNGISRPMVITGNIWDGVDQKTNLISQSNPVAGTPLTATGNTMNATGVPVPLFGAFMGFGTTFNLADFEVWNQPIGKTFRTDSSLPSLATRKYDASVFTAGQYVIWKGIIYKCKVTHQETPFSDIVRNPDGTIASFTFQPAKAEPRNWRGENTADWHTYWAEVWYNAAGAQVLDPSNTTGLTTAPPDDVTVTNPTYVNLGIGLLPPPTPGSTTTTTTDPLATTTTTTTLATTTSTTTTTTLPPGYKSVLVNLTNSGNLTPNAGTNWNNWNVGSAAAPIGISNLVYADGSPSTIDLGFAKAFTGLYNNGAGYSQTTDAWPDNVIRYGVLSTYSKTEGGSTFSVSGLNNAKLYDFYFMGGFPTTASFQYQTAWNVRGGTQVESSPLVMNNNKANVVTVLNIAPQINGTIDIDFWKIGGTYAYFSGFKIVEHS